MPVRGFTMQIVRHGPGTYLGPPYDYHEIVPIGLDPAGREVALEFVLVTVDPDDNPPSKTTELKPWDESVTRLTVLGLLKTDRAEEVSGAAIIPSAYWLRANAGRFKKLWVAGTWLDEVLDVWEKYSLNDSHAGTEAQMDAVADYLRRHPKSSYGDHCAELERQGLYIDHGFEYASEWLLSL